MHLILLHLICLCNVVFNVYSVNVESLLLTDLLENSDYDKYMRKPTLNKSEPIQVEIEIALYTVHSLDMKNQIMTTSLGIKMSWTDAFLTWNKSLYGEIDKISAPISRIWQPDVFLTNYADTSNIFDDVTKRVNIFSNGRVERHDDIEIKTYCFVNPTRYPFETETCELNFAAQQLDNNEQILHIKLPDNFLNYFKSNGEWLISKPDKIRSYMTTIENSSGRNFSGVVLQIEMERRQTYYVWKFLVPTITITLINIVTFFIPVTSGAKVPLSTFVLFVLIGIIEIFNESLPTSSDKISYFGSLLWCLLAISGLVLIVNVIITVIFKCGTCERLCAIWNCEKNGNNTNEEGDTTETQETIRSADDCSTSSCAKKGKKRTKRNYEPLQESPAKEETTISLELSEVKVELQGTEPQRQPPNEQSLRPASEDDSTKLADDKRGDNKDTTKGKRSTNRKYIGLYAVGFLVMLIAYTTAYAYFLVQIFFEKKTENVA